MRVHFACPPCRRGGPAQSSVTHWTHMVVVLGPLHMPPALQTTQAHALPLHASGCCACVLLAWCCASSWRCSWSSSFLVLAATVWVPDICSCAGGPPSVKTRLRDCATVVSSCSLLAADEKTCVSCITGHQSGSVVGAVARKENRAGSPCSRVRHCSGFLVIAVLFLLLLCSDAVSVLDVTVA